MIFILLSVVVCIIIVFLLGYQLIYRSVECNAANIALGKIQDTFQSDEIANWSSAYGITKSQAITIMKFPQNYLVLGFDVNIQNNIPFNLSNPEIVSNDKDVLGKVHILDADRSQILIGHGYDSEQAAFIIYSKGKDEQRILKAFKNSDISLSANIGDMPLRFKWKIKVQ
jgi:hypothetical protein